MTPARFRVRFESPKTGSMSVTLSQGDDVLTFTASVYHSIGDLVGALSRIALLDTYHSSVLWYTEPGEYEFRFDIKSERTTFMVVEWPDDDGRRLDYGNGRIALNVQGSRSEIVLPFWRALRQLESQITDRWEWNEPFPTHDMLELTKQVRRLKGE